MADSSDGPVDGPDDGSVDGIEGQALWARTRKVIPGGGVYFSRSARFAGKGVLPGFIANADGCRITDADGKQYIDFNCGNGPNLLGYRHPEVDAAAAAQAARMDLASFFPEIMPAYAERLLAWGRGFDWAIFGKNGSDTTNLALRVMRIARQQPYVVLFDAAYHGTGTEIALTADPAPVEQQQYLLRVPWNDVEALREVEYQHGERIAGIMINPLDQSPGRETQSVSDALVDAIRSLQANTGALLTVDDVRHGFRLHPQGSHVAIKLQPDLLCLGKALANGYSTSALLGTQTLREAVEKISFTATYMFSAVAFAAGIATLEIYERERVFDHLQQMGQRLVDGLQQAALAHGHEDLLLSGPVTMPSLQFRNDVKGKRARIFAREGAARGAIFHPFLNWFLCHAHQEADIDEAIEIAARAFAATPVEIQAD